MSNYYILSYDHTNIDDDILTWFSYDLLNFTVCLDKAYIYNEKNNIDIEKMNCLLIPIEKADMFSNYRFIYPNNFFRIIDNSFYTRRNLKIDKKYFNDNCKIQDINNYLTLQNVKDKYTRWYYVLKKFEKLEENFRNKTK